MTEAIESVKSRLCGGMFLQSKRPCMKCRKEFVPQYKFNTVCNQCQKRNQKIVDVRHTVSAGPIRAGVTPGGRD